MSPVVTSSSSGSRARPTPEAVKRLAPAKLGLPRPQCTWFDQKKLSRFGLIWANALQCQCPARRRQKFQRYDTIGEVSCCYAWMAERTTTGPKVGFGLVAVVPSTTTAGCSVV